MFKKDVKFMITFDLFIKKDSNKERSKFISVLSVPFSSSAILPAFLPSSSWP